MTGTVDALPPADRRSAFANAPMGIGLTTPEGVLVDSNPALCGMVGRTSEELSGRCRFFRHSAHVFRRPAALRTQAPT